MKTWQFSPLTQLRRFPISFLNFSLLPRSKPKETITARSFNNWFFCLRLTLCPSKFLNVETVRTLHFLSDEYDDLTASIYVSVQLKQITHCLNVLSGQVEPDAEEYSYQLSVKRIGLPEISSNETSSFCVKLFQEMGAEVSIFDTDTTHRVSTKGYVTLFTIFLKSSQVSSQQLHPGGGGG